MKKDRCEAYGCCLLPGAMIRLGKRHLFRFNHPGEAAKLREQLKGVGGY